ncbi:MAG: beta-galactosidase, partial [Sphingomonas sp.]
PGLRPATLRIDRLAATPRVQAAPAAAVQTIDGWRRSPLLDARPDPALAPADGDNNSWAFVRGAVPTAAEPRGGWQLYRAKVTPVRAIAGNGGTLAFAAVAGKAELWVDGRRVATKTAAAPGPIEAMLPPAPGERVIALIVETQAGTASGIVGPVTLRR